jgi:hypothetical protein
VRIRIKKVLFLQIIASNTVASSRKDFRLGKNPTKAAEAHKDIPTQKRGISKGLGATTLSLRILLHLTLKFSLTHRLN